MSLFVFILVIIKFSSNFPKKILQYVNWSFSKTPKYTLWLVYSTHTAGMCSSSGVLAVTLVSIHMISKQSGSRNEKLVSATNADPSCPKPWDPPILLEIQGQGFLLWLAFVQPQLHWASHQVCLSPCKWYAKSSLLFTFFPLK